MADTIDLGAYGAEVPPAAAEEDGSPIEWPDPTFDAAIPEQAPYPTHALPVVMLEAIDALFDLAGSPVPMAATVCWGALAAVAQADYAIYGLAPSAVPLSLYCVCAASSGQRKSTVSDLMMDPIADADTAAADRWQSARQTWRQMDADAKKSRPESEPANMAPHIVRSDATIEALAQRLAGGRGAQVQYLSEITSLTAGWSGREGARIKTYGDYSDLWDGRPVRIIRARDGLEISVHRRYLSTLYMGQLDPVADWVMSPQAEGGYAARVLLTYQTGMSHLPPDLDRSQIREAFSRLDHLRRLMVEALRRQCEGSEYREHRMLHRTAITMDLTAHGLMRSYLETEHVLGETATMDGDRLMASWHSRSATQAQRLAGLIVALRGYQTASPDTGLIMNADEAQAGIDLIEWYGEEMRRVSGLSMATQAAQDALGLWRAIGTAVISRSNHVSMDATGQWQGNVRQLATQADRALRRDPERRDNAIERLTIEGLLDQVPGRRATWLIHPDAVKP